MVAKMAKIGLVPGQHFDANNCGLLDKEAIKACRNWRKSKS